MSITAGTAVDAAGAGTDPVAVPRPTAHLTGPEPATLEPAVSEPTASEPAAPESAGTVDEIGARAWEVMGRLVLDNERRREVGEALGMSFSKIKALRRLAQRPMTCKELAVELLTDAPRASVLIDELVQRGLAERTVRPQDRRVRIVAVTARGAAEAARANTILQRVPDVMHRLSPQELDALDQIMRKLAA
jgi:DNA-binding MarR family transcriptional regulator